MLPCTLCWAMQTQSCRGEASVREYYKYASRVHTIANYRASGLSDDGVGSVGGGGKRRGRRYARTILKSTCGKQNSRRFRSRKWLGTVRNASGSMYRTRRSSTSERALCLVWLRARESSEGFGGGSVKEAFKKGPPGEFPRGCRDQGCIAQPLRLEFLLPQF